jgi:DNA-binding NarL/FixJ family response regulator
VTSDPLVALAEIDPAFVAWFLGGLFFLFVAMMVPRGKTVDRGARVVLVDDDEDVIRGLRFLIEERTRMGVVGEARRGDAALEVIDAVQPDLVVMDVKLPGMDGREATLRIKEEHPEVRVIGYSSPDDDATGSIMRRAGASAHLVKGDPPDVIVRTLLDWG